MKYWGPCVMGTSSPYYPLPTPTFIPELLPQLKVIMLGPCLTSRSSLKRACEHDQALMLCGILAYLRLHSQLLWI